MVLGPRGIPASIGAATPIRPETVRLTIALWTAAVIVSLATYPLFVPITPQGFFAFAPYTEGLALALAVGAYAVGRRIGARAAGLTIVFLAITVGLTAYASVAWFTIPTCGGGLSGPCFSPLVFCGLSLVSAILVAISAEVGIARLRRILSGAPAQ